MHPLVNQWINNDQTFKAIENGPQCPTDKISKLIFRIIDLTAQPRKRFFNEDILLKSKALLLEAKGINLFNSPSPDLNIMLFIFLSNVFLELFNDTGHYKMVLQAESFLTDNTHKSIRSRVVLTKALYLLHHNGQFDLVKEMLLKLNKEAGFDTYLDRYNQNIIFSCYALEGYWKETEDFVLNSENTRPKLFRNSFVDAVARGDLAASKKHLAQLQLEEHSQLMKEHIIFMNFLDNNWDSAVWKELGYTEELWPWLEHFVLLHQGRAAEALRIIKQLIQNKLVPFEENQKNLLFAELANGHIESSQRLLKRYLEGHSRHFFSAFYQMYFELICGKLSKASEYFHEVSNACAKHNAEGKLDYFLNLAPNITPSHIRVMLKEPITNKTKIKNVSLQKKAKTKVLETDSTAIMIGSSKSTKLLINEIKKFASLNVPILILGETGVGKDVVARNLHSLSTRKNHKFLPINCGAINDSILQSELFGHVAGAFTGADKNKTGIFEAAGEGTVFLDEFGEITPQLQIALLRILENNEVRPVGATEMRPIKCRILFATNANLQQMVDQNKFRKDLFYRVNKLTIQIPPLRARPKDILDLVEHYFKLERNDGKAPQLSSKLKDQFLKYAWPGNVRELKNEIEIARILNSEKSEYELDDFRNFFESKEKIIESKTDIEATTMTEEDQSKADLERARELRTHRSASGKRIKRIKFLFSSLEKVYRIDLVDILNVTPKTITKDLKKLIKKGYIEKIEPTAAASSHYFILKK
ncbi:MAG: hypothetical protein COA79_17615 [Planctomycetota bacterium]|nr:MAG: hypothetical protein COA79_17615 [Planctomycetota bacterium]